MRTFAAETTRLGYDTAYEDALRQGEQGRIDALGSLDQAIADTRLTGDIESANAAAAAARGKADAHGGAGQRGDQGGRPDRRGARGLRILLRRGVQGVR